MTGAGAAVHRDQRRRRQRRRRAVADSSEEPRVRRKRCRERRDRRTRQSSGLTSRNHVNVAHDAQVRRISPLRLDQFPNDVSALVEPLGLGARMCTHTLRCSSGVHREATGHAEVVIRHRAVILHASVRGARDGHGRPALILWSVPVAGGRTEGGKRAGSVRVGTVVRRVALVRRLTAQRGQGGPVTSGQCLHRLTKSGCGI